MARKFTLKTPVEVLELETGKKVMVTATDVYMKEVAVDGQERQQKYRPKSDFIFSELAERKLATQVWSA